jgi:5-oxoprolinase (ATP-hydrolysing) subunit A
MGHSIDMNCDMGESFGAYKIGDDEKIVGHITSANITCGFHASDPNVTGATVRLCGSHGVMAAAHPGYPDPLGFGIRCVEAAG